MNSYSSDATFTAPARRLPLESNPLSTVPDELIICIAFAVCPEFRTILRGTAVVAADETVGSMI